LPIRGESVGGGAARGEHLIAQFFGGLFHPHLPHGIVCDRGFQGATFGV
jgi:hypothetical protein